MTVCVSCGYRNTPEGNKTCNYCGKKFSDNQKTKYTDVAPKIMEEYGHKVVDYKPEEDDDGLMYIELDKVTFNKYDDDLSVEWLKVFESTGFRICGMKCQTGENIKMWFERD